MIPKGRVYIRTPDTRVVIRDRGPVGKQGPVGVNSWDAIPDKPATFPPDAHNHDDRYYTESEADILLAGKASLVAGKVPSDQLPSYVDDVLEYENLAGFPVTGEAGKIYVAADTNRTYRWASTIYVEVSPNDVHSVAGKTGDVVLEIDDINGLPEALLDPTPNSVAFDLTPTGSPAIGRLVWNPTDSTLDLPLNTAVTLQIGQEVLALVVNKTGSTIANGAVVKLTGAQGQRMKAELATSADSSAHTTLGVATQEILNNAEGFVTMHGLVRGLDTSAFTDGDELWLSTAGNITATKPAAPAHAVRVGAVVNAAAGSAGSICVHIETGSDLSDLHDALIASPVDGDILTYEASTGIWKNKPGNRGWNEQTGTTYTLVAADAGKTVRCTNASAIALSIPTNAAVAFPIGTILEIAQGGAGKITIGGSGVTIECAATNKRTTAQYAGATLKKRDTDTWWLEGRLE